MTVNETHIFTQALVNEARVGYNRIKISFNPNVVVNPTDLGISDGITVPLALPQITITSLGLNFGGPANFPQGRTVDDVGGLRHRDLSARQSHHQVRRRVPARVGVCVHERSRHVHLRQPGDIPDRGRHRVQHHARRPRGDC